MAIWKKAIFWTKMKDTVAVGGLLAQGGFELAKAGANLRLWILAGNIAAYLIGMWMEDKNQDGIVDIFETDVTVKSASPIEVQVKKNDNADDGKQ